MPVQEGPDTYRAWVAFLHKRTEQETEFYLNQRACFMAAKAGNAVACEQWEDWTQFYALRVLTK